MKVELLKDCRVLLSAGTVTEVTPATANYLLSVGLAKEVKEPEKKAAKRVKK